MSLLTMIGDVCEQIGLLRPAIVLSSLDQQVKQLLAMANREGRELATGDSVGMAYFWTALDTEATWLTTGVENQGNIATLMPGFRRIYPDTMWDRTLRQRILGITADEWQQLKAGIIQSPYFRYRFARGIVSFLPAPAINHTIATEFATFNWVNRGTFINAANGWYSDAR